MSTGKRISELRTLSGMTQDDLARKLNMSKKTIYRIENDESNPTIDILKDIAKILCINIDYLMEENDKKYFFSKSVGVKHPFEPYKSLYPYFVRFCGNNIEKDNKYYLVSIFYDGENDNGEDEYICGGFTRTGGFTGVNEEYEIRLLRRVNGEVVKNYLESNKYRYMIVNNGMDAAFFSVFSGFAIIEESCLSLNFPWYINELYAKRGELDAKAIDYISSNYCNTRFSGEELFG